MVEGVARDEYAVHSLGRSYVFATIGEILGVSLLWGIPDEGDMRAMVTAWQSEPMTVPYAFLFDAGAVTKVEPGAFMVVHDFQSANRARLAHFVVRMAMVAPPSQPGATIAGFSVLYPPPYPTEVFASREEALAWLDLAHEVPVLAALAEDVSGDDTVGALRRWLRGAELDLATLATAARALALSPRSLQRRLGEAGVTFDRERVRAQVARAKHLMRTTERTLTEISLAVGCSSSSNAIFKLIGGL